jgi:cold shock CspA family protein
MTRNTYGFIATEGGDFYFHRLDVEVGIGRTLDVGALVEFELSTDHQGRSKAVNVRQVSMAADVSPYRD